ncbi:hypothetical protein [Alloalcanivorax marinus]|uniref:hypothetical protein n=1 Tax=Alloalcanivorax marinus TaxID=1177169 RepID=UPI001932F1F6|nr:hypothetical protein [Alloalcanivorax marinus]MBL7249743.1 hypothetical protein [Alloalcanivorax marinus]
MNRSVFVKAHFAPLFKDVTVKVGTGERKRGLLGGEKEVTRKETQRQQVGWSDSRIDGARLARDIDDAIRVLNEEGYEVVGLSPVTSGAYRYQYNAQGVSSSKRILSETEKVSGGGSFGYGYGYSYTEGMVIVARYRGD